jgi:hypothetical protein
LLLDLEAGEAFGRFGLDGDVVYFGWAGAAVRPVGHAADIVILSFEDGDQHPIAKRRETVRREGQSGSAARGRGQWRGSGTNDRSAEKRFCRGGAPLSTVGAPRCGRPGGIGPVSG